MWGFIAVFSSIVLAAAIYVGERLIASQDYHGPGSILSWGIVMALAGFILWMPVVRWRQDESAPSRFDEWLTTAAFLSMGLLSFLFSLTVIRDGILGIERLAGYRSDAAPVFLFNSVTIYLVVVTALALMGLGYWFGQARPQVEVVKIELPESNAALRGLKIAQISDLHVSSSTEVESIQRLVAQVNALQCDLVVLTGDVGDGYPAQLAGVIEPLRDLKARLGIFYVTGNHEYYWDAPGWIDRLREVGVRPLLNEGITLNGLHLGGITDFESDIEKAGHGAISGSYRILLAHQPKHAVRAARLGWHLQLSGHTHGGQFWPWTWVIHGVHRHARGLSTEGGMAVYVHRGTGNWGPPIRLGSRAEIAVLLLN